MTPWSPGETLGGRYQLIAPIRRGGQGEVWRALDRTLGDQVALKLLHAKQGTEAAVARFRREASALKQVSHPSIVRCRDFFSDARIQTEGIVLELVEGPSVDAIETDPRLSEGHRYWILFHVARALAHLHARGLVHRDVKLENVIVGPTFFDAPSKVDEVKLIDLGCSVQHRNPRPLTIPSEMIGTSAYLSPEMLAPDTFDLDDRDNLPVRDVFAFGVLAMRLLEGRHPTGLALDLEPEDYAKVYREYADRSEEFPPAPDPRFTNLWSQCLALRADGRAPNASKLLAHLPVPLSAGPPPSVAGPSARGRPEESATPQPSARAQPPLGRAPARRRLKALVAALLALLGVGVAVVVWNATSKPARSSLPPAPLRSAASAVAAPPPPAQAGPVIPARAASPIGVDIHDVHASSNLVENAPYKAFDNDLATAWCEGAPGDGAGSWLEARIKPGVTVTAVEVGGGWPYDSPRALERTGIADMWQQSNVVTSMRIDWDGGSTTITFNPSMDRGLSKRVLIPSATARVRFTVLSVKNGIGGNNACLDGIKIFGF